MFDKVWSHFSRRVFMSKYPYLSDGVTLSLIPPAMFHGKEHVQNASIGLKNDSPHCSPPRNSRLSPNEVHKSLNTELHSFGRYLLSNDLRWPGIMMECTRFQERLKLLADINSFLPHHPLPYTNPISQLANLCPRWCGKQAIAPARVPKLGFPNPSLSWFSESHREHKAVQTRISLPEMPSLSQDSSNDPTDPVTGSQQHKGIPRNAGPDSTEAWFGS